MFGKPTPGSKLHPAQQKNTARSTGSGGKAAGVGCGANLP